MTYEWDDERVDRALEGHDPAIRAEAEAVLRLVVERGAMPEECSRCRLPRPKGAKGAGWLIYRDDDGSLAITCRGCLPREDLPAVIG